MSLRNPATTRVRFVGGPLHNQLRETTFQPQITVPIRRNIMPASFIVHENYILKSMIMVASDGTEIKFLEYHWARITEAEAVASGGNGRIDAVDLEEQKRNK